MNFSIRFLVIVLIFIPMIALAQPQLLVKGLTFTEGPAMDVDGNLFFSDVPEKKIYRYSSDGELTVFMENTGGANGLAFDAQGRLVMCVSKNRKVVRLEPDGKTTVLADSFQGRKLNSPNDLWIDPDGGIYFTDPRYGNRDSMEQKGMFVYYLAAGKEQLTRVIGDLERPNGIVGTPDNKMLYVVDEGERKTWRYTIEINGKLANKSLFCDGGIDGLALTADGRLAVTLEHEVALYHPSGKKLSSWPFQSHPTNVCFYNDNLYVTTQAGQVFKIKLKPGL
ncbi:SMP-30/gluconolactonase/LRE family protein [candidate division KSB1 bacterium]|nr:SMP-30/gluconolactonase/LRE family protein [candidate division KSB1 bacterium]